MNRSLGRGLSALIPDDLLAEPAQTRTGGVRSVPLGEIQPNPEQPRARFEGLDELAASLKVHGVISPLIVRPREGGGYVLIAGERRLRAAGLAGLDEVPVVVREDAGDAEVQLELALVENLQREDLDPVEAARGYKRLQQAFGYTQEEIAAKVARDRSTVANSLRLLKLPSRVLELIQDGRLSTGHAKALLGLGNHADMLDVAARVLAGELSVRATEALVTAKKSPPRRKKKADKALLRLGEELTRSLGTKVALSPRRGGGAKITIEAYSNEELERLLEKLRA